MSKHEVALDGAKLIAAERRRQIRIEGFNATHDEDHGDFTLSIAAACYAVHGSSVRVLNRSGNDAWPWEDEWDKREKHSRLRRLVIAGALIAAEIDRLKGLESEP